MNSDDGFNYKCPLAKTCLINKHCHVIKTKQKIPVKITAIIKCPMKKQEIAVDIGT